MLMPKHIAWRWLASRFSLTAAEAERLINHPKRERIMRRLEDWRDQCGLPDTRSPLVRGYLKELMKEN